MKVFDLIVIGTGSAMDIVDVLIQGNPNIRIAVIDKDEPGGTCLTRGCIPSKILLYPAELVRTIEKAKEFGIEVYIRDIDFKKVMDRMITIIHRYINMIREGLSHSKNITYYPAIAEFIAPYTLKVGDDVIESNIIFLCTGSKPVNPPIKGIENIGYYTSNTALKMNNLPKSIAIIGG